MRKTLLIILAIFASLTSFAQIENPVSWNASLEEISKDHYKVVLEPEIPNGYYIYGMKMADGGPTRTSFTFDNSSNIELVGEVIPSKEEKVVYDDIFAMNISKYFDKVQFVQEFKVTSDAKAKLKVVVEWMSCTAENCTPPTDVEFEFDLNTMSSTVAETETADVKLVSVSGEDKEEGSSMLAVIIEAIILGFAALLTPCVFPMVPMTISFFMKGSKTKAKGRAMASFYGISIVALYTVPIAVIILITYLIGGDAVTADIFNWLATHWLPNILFFIVFMVFAASFLGAFEIVMPSWLVNKSDEKADKGGIIGVFFMALTLVLVSFSCTGPIVGSILVKSTQGDIWEPIITMLVFSSAFALPFTLFAFFPSMLKTLPKSGGWLNSVKVVLGFIELALGLKFLSVADQAYNWQLLDREIYLALWIVIFTLMGFYLLGKLKFAHDSDTPHVKVKSLLLSIITFSFVVYLIPGMFGAPLKALSGYLPPQHTIDFDLSKTTVVAATASDDLSRPKPKYSDIGNLHLPEGLTYGFFDYQEGLAYAKKVDKPIFLDFTGHGCVNCRDMEANVISDPRVLKVLNDNYVIISLYVDNKHELPESEWVISAQGKTLKTIGRINAAFQVEKFGINAQPYYVLLDTNEKVLTTPFVYDKNVDRYLAFLQEGIKKFNEEK